MENKEIQKDMQVRQLKHQGVDFNPLTNVKSVFDDNGNTIDLIINENDMKLMEGYAYEGQAFPDTMPINAKSKVYYLSIDKGEYINFLDKNNKPLVISKEGTWAIKFNMKEWYLEELRLATTTDRLFDTTTNDYVENTLITPEDTGKNVDNIEDSLIKDAVRKSPQVLTDEEKLQVLKNIGLDTKIDSINEIINNKFTEQDGRINAQDTDIDSFKSEVNGKIDAQDVIIEEFKSDVTTNIDNQNHEIDIAKAYINDMVSQYKPIEIGGNVTNAADEEDLTNNIESKTIKIKDRPYVPDGEMGYVILRKGNVETLKQQLKGKTNTIFEIRYKFDLGNDAIIIPDGCTLKFNGGLFANGVIDFNDTIIDGNDKFVNITKNGTLRYLNVKTSELAKTVGDREDVPMTQKAVTDAIAPIADKDSTNGMARVNLPNKPTLMQSDFPTENTIYVIQYNYTLGEDITMPSNCVLDFNGGKFLNGNINTSDIVPINDFKGIISCNFKETANFDCSQKTFYLTSSDYDDIYNHLADIVYKCGKCRIENLFVPNGEYYVEWTNPISMPSNFNMYTLEPLGATLIMKSNAEVSYNLVEFKNVENSSINNFRLIGDRLTHEYDSRNHEWGINISISYCKNISVVGCEVLEAMGYGISTGFGHTYPPSEWKNNSFGVSCSRDNSNLELGNFDDNGKPISSEGWFRSKIRDMPILNLKPSEKIIVKGYAGYTATGFITRYQTLVLFDEQFNFIKKIDYMDGDFIDIPSNARKFAIEVKAPMPRQFWKLDKTINAQGVEEDYPLPPNGYGKKITDKIIINDENQAFEYIYPYAVGSYVQSGYSYGWINKGIFHFYSEDNTYLGSNSNIYNNAVKIKPNSHHYIIEKEYNNYENFFFFVNFDKVLTCSNIYIKDTIVSHCRCLGSAVASQNTYFNGVKFLDNGTKYKGNTPHAMMGNVDLEDGTRGIQNIYFDGCTFTNTPVTFVAPRSVRVINSTFIQSTIICGIRCIDMDISNCAFYDCNDLRNRIVNMRFAHDNYYYNCVIENNEILSDYWNQWFLPNPNEFNLINSKFDKCEFRVGGQAATMIPFTSTCNSTELNFVNCEVRESRIALRSGNALCKMINSKLDFVWARLADLYYATARKKVIIENSNVRIPASNVETFIAKNSVIEFYHVGWVEPNIYRNFQIINSEITLIEPKTARNTNITEGAFAKFINSEIVVTNITEPINYFGAFDGFDFVNCDIVCDTDVPSVNNIFSNKTKLYKSTIQVKTEISDFITPFIYDSMLITPTKVYNIDKNV